MSREVKFRAYIKSYEFIVPVDYLHLVTKEVEVQFTPEGENWLFSYDDAELMEYTGMKDSKGIDIYEGDIVRYRQRNLGQAFGHEKGPDYLEKIRDVVYMEQGFNVPGGFIKDLEVIGNIYEHPHLLEDKQ